MSRNKTFKTWEECRIWMCGAIGERWVKDKAGDFWKGRDSIGYARMPSNSQFAPFTAVRDEHGDIPEEVELPELDEELEEFLEENAFDLDFKKALQLTIAQAVRMSKEGK